MTGNLFDNAKFGDMFFTTKNKQAVFLRFAENAEYEFAILYVEGWGIVQVFRHNGKEIYNDVSHSIISKQKEPVSKDLEEAAKHYLYNNILYDDVYVGNPTDKDCIEMFKAGAKWQKQQDQSTIELAEDHAMLAGMEKMKEEMMAKAIDGDITFDYYGDDKTYGCIAHDSFCIEDFGLKDRDKVKVIVIKEK